MTGLEIVERAKALSSYKYWYGAKRQLATKQLADALRISQPKVWTPEYYSAAYKDIDGKTHVCDCSGLVCYAYNIADIGSYQIKEKFKTWKGTPKAGMIGWKNGHVGIFSRDGWDAPIIEMRSQAYDYRCDRTYKQCEFTAVLYSDVVNYDELSTQNDREVGWHSDEIGWWYRHTNGTGKDTYYHNCFQKVNGHLYCFDSDGYICNLTRVRPDSKAGWL